MLEAPKDYKHYSNDPFPIHKEGKRINRIKVKDLLSGDKSFTSNVVGHLPLIMVESYQDLEEEIKVEDLAVKHLYGLSVTDLKWITEAKTPREAGIACLYLAWRQTYPSDYPSKPALARKKAREALSL
jgi:hypothetical protein